MKAIQKLLCRSDIKITVAAELTYLITLSRIVSHQNKTKITTSKANDIAACKNNSNNVKEEKIPFEFPDKQQIFDEKSIGRNSIE